MDIHKPKAVHGWREFVNEIAVIVTGIVIALSGEQAVEWLHWRAVVAETREALNSELAGNLGVVQARIDLQPCIARRLSELRTVFVAHAKSQKVIFKFPFGQPQFPHIEANVWDTALAGQGAAHMPVELRLRYASIYDGMKWFQEKTTEQEAQAWSHLAAIDDIDIMNESDWSALHQWRADAQVLADKMAANLEPYLRSGKIVRPMFDMSAAMGIQPVPYTFRPGSKAAQDDFCRAIL
jgi:hypothetical protein